MTKSFVPAVFVATFILAANLMSAPRAMAQEDKDAEVDSEAWVPVKHLEFTPDDVEAGLTGPDGELIDVVQRAAQPSLIEIRAGFEVELVKTMDDL
jgi:hypothetical protein